MASEKVKAYWKEQGRKEERQRCLEIIKKMNWGCFHNDNVIKDILLSQINSPQTKPTDISSESEEGTLSAKDKTEDTYLTTHSIKEIKPLSGKHANRFARKMLDAEKRGSMHHE